MIKQLLLTSFILFNSVAIADQVNVDERLNLYKVYRYQLKRFTSHNQTILRRAIVAQSKDLNQDLLKRLDKIIPSPFVDSILYYTLVDRDEERLEEALVFLMLNRFLLVKQNSENQSNSVELRERSTMLLSKWSGLETWDKDSARFMLELLQRRARLISDIGSAQAVVEAIEQTPMITDHLEVETGIKSALLAEPLGPIPGNLVAVFFKNDRSLARARSLRELGNLSPDTPSRVTMASQLASDSLVKPLFDMIHESQQNFILVSPKTDGVSEDALINSLRKKLEVSDSWKIIFIGIGNTSPRILALANSYRSRFAIMSIPDVPLRDGPLSWQALIPTPDDRYPTQHGLGLLALSDTNAETPRAFITSRRFVDHPHAYSFEQSLTLQGPAAGLLPQLLHENLTQLLPSHTDVSSYFPSRTHYPAQGPESVNLTVDSARLGARDDRALAVKFLLEAKEQVLLDQHMLYDRAIVDTLIKLKIKNPDLKVLVMLDTNLEMGMNGLPNSIFLAEMKRYGIELKARRALLWEENENADVTEKHGINHRNIIIRDGRHVFMGTGPFTGSFERRSPISFGVQVSSAMSAELADNFLRDWDNPDATYELDIENFQARFDDMELSRQVSGFLNDVFSLLLRAFD